MEVPLIAVIDDDVGMRQSLEGLVRSLGYRAALFDSAEQFLDAPEAGLANCVITDLQMPGGMSGIDLANRVEARLKGRVILLSAFLDDRVYLLAEAAGVCCFLRKPFDGERLIGCIEAALAA